MEYEEDEETVSSSLAEEDDELVFVGVDWVVVLLGEGCWEEDFIPLASSSILFEASSFESFFLFNLFSIAKVSASSSIAVFPYFV